MAEAEERIIRVFRPSVIVLCGPAACGKSSFATRHFRPTQIISSDFCRALVCDDERDQRYHQQAFALVYFLIGQRLSVNRLCVVDSTALTPEARKALLDIGRKFRVRVELFLFNVPLAKCLEFDRKRERTVGSKVIEEHFQLLSRARASLGKEGFDQIQELREEDLQSVRIEILYRPVFRLAPEGRERDRRASRPSVPDPGPRC